VHIDGPDYAELGRPFGMHGEKVEKPAQLKGAIENSLRAMKDGKSAILNVELTN
jgi:thiamine pyrophosphate-dependent acetolactate synthase large subunit-like protein